MFDRDDHASYFNALELAASLDDRLRNDNKRPVAFKAIASVPSFEPWLLLHDEDIQAPTEAVHPRLREGRGPCLRHHPRPARHRHATSASAGRPLQRLQRPRALHRHRRTGESLDYAARRLIDAQSSAGALQPEPPGPRIAVDAATGVPAMPGADPGRRGRPRARFEQPATDPMPGADPARPCREIAPCHPDAFRCSSSSPRSLLALLIALPLDWREERELRRAGRRARLSRAQSGPGPACPPQT